MDKDLILFVDFIILNCFKYMLNFSLIGAGRIGKMHAEIINS